VSTALFVVALELLREESSISSAKSTSSHFGNANQAEREFQRISVQERSKFDKETGMLSLLCIVSTGRCVAVGERYSDDCAFSPHHTL